MPMLVCRRCKSDSTEVASVSTYSRKRRVVIRCKDCENCWVVAAPRGGDLMEFLNSDKIIAVTAPTQKPETAMSLAFKKALEKKKK